MTIKQQTRWLRIPIVYCFWSSGHVPGLPSYGVYISQLVRFARCYTSISDFHSKNLQITSILLTQGYRYHKLGKSFGKFFSVVTAVAPTERPKSVCNRCIIEVFGGVFYVVALRFGFFCECGGLCHQNQIFSCFICDTLNVWRFNTFNISESN